MCWAVAAPAFAAGGRGCRAIPEGEPGTGSRGVSTAPQELGARLASASLLGEAVCQDK